MNTPIHVFAKWTIKPEHLEAVLTLLKTIREETLKEKDNLFYTIHQSTTDPNTIILFEGYTSEAAIATHRNTPHYQDLVIGKIIPLLEHREVVLTTPVGE